jgi:hypothetical protein
MVKNKQKWVEYEAKQWEHKEIVTMGQNDYFF